MKRIALILAVILVALTAYLSLWPVPVDPVCWKAPTAPGYTGLHAVNNKLAGLKVISLGAESGPEHIVLAKDGKLYAAVTHGNILRMNADGTAQEVFVNTGGRVLGFDFDATGNLIAADAHKGLLSISPDRQITVLADKVGDDPIRFADAVVVAANGKIYFSDASTRFAAIRGVIGSDAVNASLLDVIEQSATGRILEYDPAAKTTRIVVRGLSFANGVALSRDERTLFVVETGRYRVWKIDVTATNLDIALGAPQATVLLDNLPGFPDNLMRGLDGKIWLGLPVPRSAKLDGWAEKPFMRKLMLRLPSAMMPAIPPYGHAIAFTEDGKVVADLQDPTGAFPNVTGITETADRLYVQNLNTQGLGWLAR
ncbi:MAG: SMP-30/gluconolactonase/LRE family protein [Deltaproteobacteria bacterium]|nr:SMP-30/gluconolactonase/LRE family protein [Deltaproteobacteria bacterium]